ncbi:MAG: hypothetical protein HY223_06045 [Thaumarchaeota archaeon]|nr:hypothetical protein [Nitrososphaerota archaeon]
MDLPFQIPPFKEVALERLAKIIGDNLTGSEIQNLCQRSGLSHIKFTNDTKWKFVYSTLEQLQNEKEGQNKIIKIIEQLCDPQEFFNNVEKRHLIIYNINVVLSFYKMKYDIESSTIIHDDKIEPLMQGKADDNPLLARLQALWGGRDVLGILMKSEQELSYESLKQYFPLAPNELFDNGLGLLEEYSLVKVNENGKYVATEKAKDIFLDDLDPTTRILKLLRIQPFDLNEISHLLHIKSTSIMWSLFVYLDQEGLVTSSVSRPYSNHTGQGNPVIHLTTKGIDYLKKPESSMSSNFTIGTAQNVYVANTITINNIQNTIDQLITQLEHERNMDDKTKKLMRTKLENLKLSTNELIEFAKSIGVQFTVEALKKFFFPS